MCSSHQYCRCATTEGQDDGVTAQGSTVELSSDVNSASQMYITSATSPYSVPKIDQLNYKATKNTNVPVH